MALANETFGRQPTSISAGAVWVLLSLIGATGVFWIGLEELLQAWQTAEYSHGPIIPIVSLYLFLRQLKYDGVVEQSSPIPGILVLVFSLLLATVGNLARIADVVGYAIIFWVYGILLTHFGWRQGVRFTLPVIHLAFMLPLPAFIYWQISIQLQFISSELGVFFVRAMGIPVFLNGNIIDLGIYKLHVAEACSGLRYLFPILSFTYMFSVLYQGPLWHKVVLLLLAVPIAIFTNSLRIGIIGIMVNFYGIGHAEGFLHLFEGWVIFILCLLMMFMMVRVLQFIRGDKRSMAEALDLRFEGLGTQAAQVMQTTSSVALAAVASLTLLTGALWQFTPDREVQVVERTPLALFPTTLGEWQAGPQIQLDRWVQKVLAADDYYSAQFHVPDRGAMVDVFIAWYRNQAEGSGIHSPEACIPGGGWEMSRIVQTSITVNGPDGATIEVPVNRAVIQRGLDRQLVYYWFEQRGRRMTSDYAAKAYTVLDGITRGRSDGALVRIITPLGRGEAESGGEARLLSFMQESISVLPRFIPN